MLIFLGVIATATQLICFGSKTLHQIDADGISYTRIATEIRLVEFHQSINAFRSPLVSWLIAVTPYLTELQAGKLISVLTFLSTLILLYVLTNELWHSQMAAALAVLLMTLARGVPFLAVAFVTPDFIFASLTVAYFLALLRSLRDERRTWWHMGLAHGIAFLAKGFALPWLVVCTSVAAVYTHVNRRSTFVRIASALVFPALVAGTWASILHHKYGVFTTGSQFKVNLSQWTLRGSLPKQPSKYALLTDTTLDSDENMVGDPMPPGSWMWHYEAPAGVLIWGIVRAETRNVPKAAKEIVIFLTPGAVIAFIATFFVILKSSARGNPERIFVMVVSVASVALIGAYSMLVIDGRYFLPILPLWFAVGSAFLVTNASGFLKIIRLVSLVLVVCGVIFVTSYHASPWRTERHDWQIACYNAGAVLNGLHARSVVSIGMGPYPQYGVGWEAGYKASYFGRARLIATTFSVPVNGSELAWDVSRAAPDAVLLWTGNAKERLRLESSLLSVGYSIRALITDPYQGEIGTVLFRKPVS